LRQLGNEVAELGSIDI